MMPNLVQITGYFDVAGLLLTIVLRRVIHKVADNTAIHQINGSIAVGRQARVMSYQQHRTVALAVNPAKQLKHVGRCLGIQITGGLIGQ